MVEVAPLAVEDVRVRLGAEERRPRGSRTRRAPASRSGPPSRSCCSRRGGGRPGRPVPVGSVASHAASAVTAFTRTALQLPWPSPASGASHALPLLLRWLMSTMNRAPVAFSANAWASDGRFRGSGVAPVDERDGVQHRGLADRGHDGRLVDHPDLDRVGAERVGLAGPPVGVDEGVRARSRGRVEPVDEERDRAGRAVPVVLDLVEADDVRRSSARNAATVFAHWRSNSAWQFAPRQSASEPPGEAPRRRRVPRPSNVLKKLSRFIAATFTVPPTSGAEHGPGVRGTKRTEPPRAPTGRTRYALGLAAFPPHV